MRIVRLFLLIALLVPVAGIAQNWQTVRLGDTAYFSAGKHFSYKGVYYYPQQLPPMIDTPLLRIMYIAGLTVSGSDTVFQFFTSFRDTTRLFGIGDCADTLAPSWLGPRFIRKANGTEYYFNSRKDTITILTQAASGNNWVLAKDTGGRRFVGTISQAGTMSIDGVTDSFKTISIQAYSGSTAVSDPYNAKVLQLSKSHGWIKVLDFYRFPNSIWDMDRTGIAIDSTQHVRLPAIFSNGRMVQDIAWKFSPGNEWIWKSESGYGYNPDYSPRLTLVQHDSVRSFQSLGQHIGLATMRTVQFTRSHVYFSGPTSQGYNDSSGTTITVHTDTVRDVPGSPVPRNAEEDFLPSTNSRYFIWPYDGTRYFITRADLGHFVFSSRVGNRDTCMRLGYTLNAPDDWAFFGTYLPDFGLTGSTVWLPMALEAF